MSDLGNIDLDKEPGDPQAGGNRIGGWVVGALLLALAAGGGYYYYSSSDPDAPLEPPAVTEPPPSADMTPPPPAAEPDEPLPTLDASDELARRLIGELTSRPEIAAWLVTDDLISSIASMVDRVGRGEIPVRQLSFLAPTGTFAATDDGTTALIDPSSYARYDTIGQLVDSIDPEGAAATYGRLEPLLDEAYRDLGYPEGSFSEALDRAIAEILAAPVIEGDVRLATKGALYRYADDRLESASPVQRQLVRMGPRNLRLIQEKVRAFDRARFR